jgi:glycosyltransferase involved in cell wall biosynthesis
VAPELLGSVRLLRQPTGIGRPDEVAERLYDTPRSARSQLMDSPDIGIFFGRPERSETLAGHLRARGFRVTLYGHRGTPGAYVVVRWGWPSALRRLLATHHDVYLTGLSFVPSFSLYLNRLARGLPYVFNATGVKAAMYRERARRWPAPRLAERVLYPSLTDRVLAGASAIVCNSRYLEGRLGAQFPAYRHKMTTIYNGVDFDRFASGRPIPIGGVPRGAPTLLAVMSWSYAAKADGGRMLIDAMGAVTRRVPSARLVIAAHVAHRRYADANEAHLATRPWRDAVRILYNHAAVPDLLASADVFVYATPDRSNDSLPRAVLEAHAAGLPVVTTATAGCPEIVADSVTGVVVPYDPEAIADGVVTLLEDGDTRRRFGQEGQARVRDIFGWDRMADGYARVIRHILSHEHRATEVDGCLRTGGGAQ